MIPMARTFGAPVTDPDGKIALKRSMNARSAGILASTVDVIWKIVL